MNALKYNQLLYVGLMLLLFVSCSMEKRVYTSGYHLNWAQSRQNAENPKHMKDRILSIKSQAEQESIVASNVPNTLPDYPEKLSASLDNSPEYIIPPLNSSFKEPFVVEKRPKKEIKENVIAPDILVKAAANKKLSPENEKTQKSASGFVVLAFISGLLSFLYAPIGILAVIFGIIGLIKILRHRDQYKGLGVAIASILLGLLTIALYFARCLDGSCSNQMSIF
jgi:hypothetical protein